LNVTALDAGVALAAPLPYAYPKAIGATMVEYLMRIYLPGERLHQTKRISAPDDATAEAKAQKIYDELAAELKTQTNPKIEDPRLERFTLYRGDHLVSEKVSR
jgi:hypothetical protein